MNTIYILLCDACYYDDYDCLSECDTECFSGAFSTEAMAKAAIFEEYNKPYDGLTKSEYSIDVLDGGLEVVSWKRKLENTDAYWSYDYYVIKVTIDKLWNGD